MRGSEGSSCSVRGGGLDPEGDVDPVEALGTFAQSGGLEHKDATEEKETPVAKLATIRSAPPQEMPVLCCAPTSPQSLLQQSMSISVEEMMNKIPSLASLTADSVANSSQRHSRVSKMSPSRSGSALSGGRRSGRGMFSLAMSKSQRFESQCYDAVDIELARGISIRRSLRGFGRVWRYNPSNWTPQERAKLYQLSRPEVLKFV